MLDQLYMNVQAHVRLSVRECKTILIDLYQLKSFQNILTAAHRLKKETLNKSNTIHTTDSNNFQESQYASKTSCLYQMKLALHTNFYIRFKDEKANKRNKIETKSKIL